MVSLGVLGRTVLASGSGYLVDWMNGDWSLFFILTAVMVMPSLFFLWYIRHDVNRLEQQNMTE
jgi:PAT family beta-lactamase induction signal transducer AmpG